jgi:hypothetical protein
MRTTAQLRTEWAPACPDDSIIRLDFVPGVRVNVHRMATEAYEAMASVILAHRYAVRAADTGAYNCRTITGGSGHSLHAYGIALDINWNSNPYRADNKLITDMPPAMVQDILKIRTRTGKQVFRWGGNYRTVKDAMHYELVISPAEAAERIDWKTVKQPPKNPLDPATWPILRRGDTGPTVAQLQDRLILIRLLTEQQKATGPGVFGPRTELAVKQFQGSRKLTVDGIVGLQTWTALLTHQPEVDTPESPVKNQTSKEC